MRENLQTLKYKTENRVITIWLNRPEVHNAFNRTMLSELVEILKWINESEEIRVVIFTGEGKSFSVICIEPTFERPVKFAGTEFIRIGEVKKKLADFPEHERALWLATQDGNLRMRLLIPMQVRMMCSTFWPLTPITSYQEKKCPNQRMN